jgi:hypothetical protein
MKSLSKFLAFALLVWGANTASAQNLLQNDAAKKADEVKTLVNSGKYTFSDEKMNTNGDIQQANYGTDIDISKDTLIVYLPNLGKTAGTPVNAQAAGITCINFSYNMVPAPDGGYDVSISPKAGNAKDIRDINMHISKMGYADVKVTTDHGPLQYHGYIRQHQASFPITDQMASTD